ncbi:hypothetical protein ONS96_013610 [Cadophora gregata f. sp. sojae]|nr:hypothetical protein ONS96_013610 [Cadophora gregata f. sp. sojae]
MPSIPITPAAAPDTPVGTDPPAVDDEVPPFKRLLAWSTALDAPPIKLVIAVDASLATLLPPAEIVPATPVTPVEIWLATLDPPLEIVPATPVTPVEM